MDVIGILIFIVLMTGLMSYIKGKEKQLKKQQRNKSRTPYKKNRQEVQKFEKNMKEIREFEKQMFASQKSAKNKSSNKSKTYNKHTQANKDKGDIYEIYLINHFKGLGYIVVEHGLMHGKRDRGIDIILRKGKENLFVQAKNWKREGPKIDHTMIKSFIGDVAFYIEDNPAFALANIKRYYITSNDVLDGSAKNFIREHSDKIEHFVMPMP